MLELDGLELYCGSSSAINCNVEKRENNIYFRSKERLFVSIGRSWAEIQKTLVLSQDSLSDLGHSVHLFCILFPICYDG